MNWSFIVNMKGKKMKDLKDLVKEKTEKIMENVAEEFKPNDNSQFKVNTVFYQKQDRYLKSNRSISREDWGVDLDNLLKKVFDGLGAILGYRKDWKQKEGEISKSNNVLDSKIIEVHAKKLNSGSDEEYLSVEISEIKF